MIQFHEVTASFTSPDGQRFPAVRQLSLQINDGEYVTIMGKNGSGKTTLARLCNGLVLPTAGRVVVDGLEISPGRYEHIPSIRRRVGMVFQNPENQIVSTTVEREIAFGLENLCIEQNEMHQRVDTALVEFELERYRQRPPHQLSGGEKQRLAIAAVMAMQPRHLILDEPTTLLDLEHRRKLLALLVALNKGTATRQPCTIINVTQFPEEALFASRLIILHDGDLVFDDHPHQIFMQEDRLRAIGLLPPIEFSAFIRLQKIKFPLTSIEEISLSPIL